MSIYHEPVLLRETIELLDPKPNENFIDGTLGGGGHASEILKKNGSGKLLGIDIDQDALREVGSKLANYQDRIILVQDNFSNLENIVRENNFRDVDGILLDLGVSFHQLATSERGFSYRLEGELDMRMGKDIGLNAQDLVNDLSGQEIKEILIKYGEVQGASRIVQKIINYRKNKKIVTTKDLKEAIVGENEINKWNIKILSQVFQALRIAVNNELESLKGVLSQALDLLKPSGRMVVISYHSLEDRIVKRFFQKESRDCICPDEMIQCNCSHKKSLKIITKKPIIASNNEITKNKKSRSAKLRAIVKI